MSEITEIGDRMVAEVAGMFAAEETIRTIQNGFEWGLIGARQRWWWEDPVMGEEGGPDLVRMRILTELGEAPRDAEQWPDSMWMDFLGLGEDNIWGGALFAEELDGRLCLGAAVSAHEGNTGYLPLVLFRVMAAHAATRENLFDPYVVEGFGDALVGAPAGAMAELAESFELLVERAGKEIPDGVDRDMAFLVEQFQDYPCLMCHGDEGGLSAEFPFGEDSSLLRIDTSARNHCHGTAIGLSLLLPLDGENSSTMTKNVLELNRREQTIHEIPWSLGSWYLDEGMSPRIGYRLWLPYAYFQPNLLINLAIGMVARARRCCEKIAGMTFDEAYPLASTKMEERLLELLDLMGEEGDDKQ